MPEGLASSGRRRTARRGPGRSSAVEGEDHSGRLRRSQMSPQPRGEEEITVAFARHLGRYVPGDRGPRGWKLARPTAFGPCEIRSDRGRLECGHRGDAVGGRIRSSSSSAPSAGGIEALSRVVGSLPPDFPAPIVIAQHLDPRRPSHLGGDPRPPRHAADQGRRGRRARSRTGSSSSSRRTAWSRSSTASSGCDRPSRAASRRRSTCCSRRRRPPSGPASIAVILTGQRQRRIGRRLARQAGRWGRHHREPGDGAVPVDAPLDLPIARRRDGRPRFDRRGAAAASSRPAGRRPKVATAANSRRCSTGSASAAASTSARTRPPRSSAGCAAGWARRRYASARRLREAARARPGGVREAHQQPPDQGDRVLPRPEGLRAPADRHLARAHRGRSTGRPPAARLVGRLLDGRGGLFARDHPLGGPRRPSALAVDVRVFATDIDGAAIAFARRGVYPPAALQKVPAAIRERYFVKSDGGYEVVEVPPGADDVRRARPRGAGAVPADRPDPVSQRPHLLHRCRCSARRSRPSASRCATTGASSSGRPRRSRRCPDRLRRGSRPAADLPARPRAAAAAARAGDARPAAPASLRAAARRRDPLDPPRRPGRGRLDARPPRRCCSTCASGSSSSTRATTSPGSTPRLGGCSGSTDWRSTRTSSISPSPCHRRPSGPPSMPRSAARPRRPSTRSRRRMSRPRASRSSRRSSGPTSGKAGRGRGRGHRAHRRQPRPNGTAGRAPRPSAALTGRRSSTGGLLRANEELTALVAQLRMTNQTMLQASEEAQSGREEVETLNEEFQATNEELETLNEELTASVEELRVANEDLARADRGRCACRRSRSRNRSSTARRSTTGSQSVLASLGDAVVAVDHAGRTVATNPAYDRLFGGPDAEIQPGGPRRPAAAAGRLAAAASRPGRAVPDGVRGQRPGRHAALVRGGDRAAHEPGSRRGAASSPSATSRNARCGSAWSG